MVHSDLPRPGAFNVADRLDQHGRRANRSRFGSTPSTRLAALRGAPVKGPLVQFLDTLPHRADFDLIHVEDDGRDIAVIGSSDKCGGPWIEG